MKQVTLFAFAVAMFFSPVMSLCDEAPKPVAQCPFVRLEPAALGNYPKLWNKNELFKRPKMTPATDLKFDFEYADNVKPIYLDGIDFKGEPTRFFAWFGMPKEAAMDKQVPGVVLVHGGGGTAFVQWVEEWTARGYAAIAMDTVGCRPVKRFEGGGCRVELSGDRPGMLHDYNWEVANCHDSWTAHAVGTVIRSHSYLRSHPEVDAASIGIVGISWGGYLTCIAAAVDNRFAAAVPVYGCGFLGEFVGTVSKANEPWLKLFDPCMFLSSVNCPILFVNRPVDTAYFWEQWVRSSLLPAKAERSCRLGFGHSHAAGRVPEANLFLDAICKGMPRLPKLEKQLVADGVVTAEFKAEAPVSRATIAWSDDDDSVTAPKRKWQEAPAEIKGNVISASIPPKALRFYLNLYDQRGGVVSTDGAGWDRQH